MVSAVNALIKTPAAAKSFIFLIFSCFSGEIKSAIFSIEELKISAAITNPMAITMAIHSSTDISNINPAIVTTIAITK